MIGKKTLMLVGLLSCSSISFAQGGWKWPEDSAQARRQVTYYTDAMKNGQFEKATEGLSWLLENAPDINQSIYINGVKIYDSLAAQTQDDLEKTAFLDKKLSLYDQRILVYGETRDLLKRKLIAAYRAQRNRPDKLSELHELQEKVMNSYQPQIPESIFIIGVDLLNRQAKHQQIQSPEEIWTRYDQLLDRYDKNSLKSEKTYAVMNKVFKKLVKLDCEKLDQWLSPKISQSPKDSVWVKRALTYAFDSECTESTFFTKAATIMIDRTPSYALCRLLASKYEKKGEIEKASEFYDLAIQLASDEEKKYKALMAKARYQRRRSNWRGAKATALQAGTLFPQRTEVNELIGDLYVDGAESCQQKVSIVDDRAIYIAAYDQYRLAGNSQKMTIAEQQFPSITEIFNESRKEGELIEVGCWINEKVSLKRRKQVANE